MVMLRSLSRGGPRLGPGGPPFFNTAPEPLEPEFEFRWPSSVVVASHLVASVCLTLLIWTSLYRSYYALGPALETKKRRAQRYWLVPLFAILALSSLGSAIYTSLQHVILSYKVWAGQQDINVPPCLYGHRCMLPPSYQDATQVFIFQFLSDTSILLDSAEILAEHVRRHWWAQQIELGLISWNLFLAIEGRRRNMPFLLAYSLLGQLVSLSYSQNLFFIALLLTPSPLPIPKIGHKPSWFTRVKFTISNPKPPNWTPHASLTLLVLTLNFAVTWATPLFANSPTFKTLVLASRGLSLTPLLLPYVVPRCFGTTHAHPRQAYGTYMKLFQCISFVSCALHANVTAAGLAHHAPDSHLHRHSSHLLFDIEGRLAWDRTRTAFGKLLGATSDHPVVVGVGTDVLLSAGSLGLWAAVCAQDTWDMLCCVIPFRKANRRLGDTDSLEAEIVQSALDNKGGNTAEPEMSSDNKGLTSRISRAGQYTAKSAGDNDAYQPSPSVVATTTMEGDVLLEARELDWESAALTWGLAVLGGLGVASAGVLGGECLAR